VSVCDVVEDQIAKAKTKIGLPDAKSYTNFQHLLDSKNNDALMIATPVNLHPQHEAVLKRAKHIYMGKPAGRDVAGCKRVIRADRKINIVFGFQQRYGGVDL